jgi:hypothetical protein
MPTRCLLLNRKKRPHNPEMVTLHIKELTIGV